MLTVFVKFVSFMLSAVMFLSTPLNFVTGKQEKKITDKEEDCALSFSVISDMHLRGNDIFGGMLELGLLDMSKAEDKLDAAVFNGDITDHGYIEMWDTFASSVAKYDIAEKTFVVVGNHDTWGPNRDDFENPVDGVKPTFIKYNKIVSDRDITEMYYSDTVNGYYFICLGSEHDNTNAYISDTQLEWFAGEMEKAAATGLPIFVFMHQSINGTHGLPYNWELNDDDPADEGGIGPQSDAVLAILKKYDNVFYISGHIHAGLKNGSELLGPDYTSVDYIVNDNGNNITLINTPSYMYFDVQRGGHLTNGNGFVIEAYADKVIVRGRNFATGTWLTNYDTEIELVK